MTSKEDLQTLLEYFYYQGKSPIIVKEQANFILNKIEKDLEILEIINTHLLDIGKFYEDFIEDKFDYSVYLDDALYYEKLDENEEPITQQKFNLIREWLENEIH